MTWKRTKPAREVYGSAHDRERRERAKVHDEMDPCTRCFLPLGPMGPWLHLDHDDVDKSRYRGFAHGYCNINAGARLGRARQRVRASREW